MFFKEIILHYPDEKFKKIYPKNDFLKLLLNFDDVKYWYDIFCKYWAKR